MSKPSSGVTAPVDPTPVALVAPTPTLVVVLADESKGRRAALEKELMGVRAKLRWTHISEWTRQELEARREALMAELAV